ncbi:MAG: HAD hydrolase-like protein [Oscillospiraceae bacterium]
MDGTLLDSTDGIIAALQEMEKRMGLAPLSMAELRGFIGPPLKESFIKYYGAAPEETRRNDARLPRLLPRRGHGQDQSL